MNLSFLNPWLLWALPLSLLPVLFHFFFRRPPKIVPFSDIRFLKKILEKYRPKKKLQEWLILLLRILSLACLFFFFSRPVLHWAGGEKGGSEDSLALVVLLDNSYSMGTEVSGISLWDMARGLAQKAFGTLREIDRASLIVFSDRIEFFSGQLSNDYSNFVSKIKKIPQSFRNTDLLPALQMAYSILSNSGASQKAILVISDMAKNGWSAEARGEWQSKIHRYDSAVRILYTDFSIKRENVAVEGFSSIADFYTGTVKGGATVKNWGEKEVRQLPLFLELQELEAGLTSSPSPKRRMETLIHLGKKERKKVPLSISFSVPENYAGKIGIQQDGLPADDRFYFIVSAPKRIRLLCVEEPSGLTALSGESFYLRQALLSQPSPFELKVISIQELKKTPLKEFAALLLVHPGELDREAAMEIKRYLKGGGSLLLALSERRLGENFRILSDFLPCDFGEPRTVNQLSLEPIRDSGDEEFSFFQQEYEWDKIKVQKMVQPILKENGEPWILLSDGTPALILSKERKIAVWMSSVDRSWNNFPSKPVFPPFVRWLTSRLTSAPKMEVENHLLVGQTFRKKFFQNYSKDQIQITSSQGHPIPFQFQQKELVSQPLEEPGIYRLSVRQNPGESLQFAVNVDSQKGESDLTPVSSAELKKLLPKTFFQSLPVGEQFESDLVSAMRGVEISRSFLIFAGLFLFTELWLLQRR